MVFQCTTMQHLLPGKYYQSFDYSMVYLEGQKAPILVDPDFRNTIYQAFGLLGAPYYSFL